MQGFLRTPPFPRNIHCLKQSGLTIKEIKEFMQMLKAGDSSLETRLELFRGKQEDLAQKPARLEKFYDILDYKCWYYETAERDNFK